MKKTEQLNTKRVNQTPLKITSPAMMDICESECPEDTSPVEMEEGEQR